MTIAEESTAWPGVTRPTHLGGLGFGFKWNMGWMHDTLDYIARDPIYRQYHHHEMTFSLVYAYSENFVLPISPRRGRARQGLAAAARCPATGGSSWPTLRALLAFMWAHPGKQLLFMGGEFGQEPEWAEQPLAGLVAAGRPGPPRACSAWSRDLNRVYRDDPGAVVAGHRRRTASAGSTPTTPPTTCSRSCAAGDRRLGAGLRGQLRRRCRTRATGRAAAAGRWDEVLNTDAEPTAARGVGNLGARRRRRRAVARPAGLGHPAGAAARRALAAVHRRAGLGFDARHTGRLARCGSRTGAPRPGGTAPGGAATRGGHGEVRWRRLAVGHGGGRRARHRLRPAGPRPRYVHVGAGTRRRTRRSRSTTPTTARSTRWPATPSPTSSSSGPRRCRGVPRAVPAGVGFYSIDPDGSVAAPCTEDPSDIRGNAFYCPARDIVAWDRKILLRSCKERFGDFLVAMVLAHEWGHAIQKRTKLPSDRTIVVETQADCYAGRVHRLGAAGNARTSTSPGPTWTGRCPASCRSGDPLGAARRPTGRRTAAASTGSRRSRTGSSRACRSAPSSTTTGRSPRPAS